MESTAIYYNPAFLRHDTGSHPENAERLAAIVAALRSAPFANELAWPEFEPAGIEEIKTIHDEAYIARVHDQCIAGGGRLDPDTVVSPDSWDAATLAAGAVLAAVDAVMGKTYRTAFCAVRPPGHHAEADKAMGFCLFNNIAIGARRAVARHKAQRVAIIDFDVHHGNGTQHAFYEDPSVYYISTHLAGHYPGTGWENETGSGAGIGTTMNIPLQAGCGDAEYMEKLEGEIIPTLEKYRPELILLSAGFDAHMADPLGGMALSTQGYHRITQAIAGLADSVCGGRIVSALEGGYDPAALAQSAAAHVAGLMGPGPKKNGVLYTL
jgi:acetoin utilization deacetylase AcuC-like enzyme